MANPWEDFQDASAEAAPWEEFKAGEAPWEQNFAADLPQASYSNEGRGRELKGADLIPGVQPVGQPKADPSLGEKSLGLLEQIPVLASSMTAQIEAPVSAAIKKLTGMTDKSFEEQTAEDLAARTYTPRTEAGQDYAGRTGEFINRYVMPVAPMVGMPMLRPGEALNAAKARQQRAPTPSRLSSIDKVIADKQASAVVDRPLTSQGELFEPSPGQLIDQGPQLPDSAPAVPPRGALSNRRQMDLVEEGAPLQVTREGVAGVDDTALLARNQQMDALAAEMEAQRPLQNQSSLEGPEGQMALFDQEAGQLPTGRSPYEAPEAGLAAHWAVDENGIPVRADKSMEAVNLENPLQRNLWGDELGPALGQERSLTEAIDSIPKSPFVDDARDLALSRLNPTVPFNFRKQGGGVLNPFERKVEQAKRESPIRWFTASPEAGRKMGYSLESQAARPNAEGQRYGPGQYIAQSRDFSSVYGGPEGRMYEVEAPFTRPFDVDRPGAQKTYDTLVQAKGGRAGANAALKAAGYDAITFTSPRGDKLANIFNERPLKDIGPAREKIRQQELTLAEYEPGKLRKQAGAILLPGKGPQVEKLKHIPGIKEKMVNFLPDRSTPEEFVAAHRATPDLDQNAAQRLSNYFTKGIDYMVERTNNPLIKRVADVFREAEGKARAAQNEIVHEIYTPTLRKLDKQEFVETWAALKKMEEAGVKLSDEELINAGYTQKERDAIRMHQTIMNDMVPKINATLDALGLSHIKPEAFYVASKMTGNFRLAVLATDAAGEKTIVGFVGGNTRKQLNEGVKAWKEKYPDYEIGPETQHMGGAKGRVAGNLEDMLSFLGNSDENIALFLERSKQMMDDAAMSYRGAKTHTMLKKGIEGMEGSKFWEDPYTNAKEGFEAQVAYLNRMLEWAEKAKALEEVRPLLDSPELKMPEAKAYAQDYIDMQLGRNPTQVGRAVDSVFASFGGATGLGTKGFGKAMQNVRQLVNTKLLSLNPGFLLANVLQPMRVMPEMTAFLGARGIKAGEPTGLSHNFKAALYQAQDLAGQKLDPVIQGALDYARDNHVYASDLFEKSNDVRGGTGRAIMNGLQKPAAYIESQTRQNVFLAFVDMLHENGITPKDGLYEAARRATDMGMNNYSPSEAPMFLQNLGSAHRAPYNLMSYKFNELSRVAMMARDIKNQNTVRPILTAIAAQVAFSGLMGTVYFKEADWLYRKISEMLGKPGSLTKLLLDNSDKKIVGPVTLKELSYGGPAAAGADLSNRLGMGYVAGDFTQPLDIAMPGAGALVDAGSAAIDLAKDPSKYNAMKAAVEIIPGGQLLDRYFFSKPGPKGEEMAMSRSKTEATVTRNDADKAWKSLGITGVNESSTKTRLFENQRIDKWYADKQKVDVQRMAQSFFTSGKISQTYIKDFIAHQGNPETLDRVLENIAIEQNLDATKRDALKIAVQNSYPAAQKMKRRFQ